MPREECQKIVESVVKKSIIKETETYIKELLKAGSGRIHDESYVIALAKVYVRNVKSNLRMEVLKYFDKQSSPGLFGRARSPVQAGIAAGGAEFAVSRSAVAAEGGGLWKRVVSLSPESGYEGSPSPNALFGALT